jgi:hypothetical protein
MFTALPTFDDSEHDTFDMPIERREALIEAEQAAMDEADIEPDSWEIAWYDIAYATRTAKENRDLEQIAGNLINSKGIIYGCDLAALMYEIEGR